MILKSLTELMLNMLDTFEKKLIIDYLSNYNFNIITKLSNFQAMVEVDQKQAKANYV